LYVVTNEKLVKDDYNFLLKITKSICNIEINFLLSKNYTPEKVFELMEQYGYDKLVSDIKERIKLITNNL